MSALSPLLFPLLLPLWALSACRSTSAAGKAGADTAAAQGDDEDGDGVLAGEDCDDQDASTSPAAAEICDGVDNNCDGQVDEGVTAAWYADEDGDGFGDPSAHFEACEGAAGAVANDSDCDDTNERVYPGAPDLCDALDNDCDGEVDEDGLTTWYADSDADGFGDRLSPIEACAPPEGYVNDDQDCNDETAEAHPGHAEVCDEIDNDCDGDIDEDVELTWYADHDEDGWGLPDETTEACSQPAGYAAEAGDCDDDDPAYHPAAPEPDCTDPNDYNCDGAVGYADDDLDGWAACAECDDTRADIHPDAQEVCDGLDNDCDTLIDDLDASLDTTTTSTWYTDGDGDGYGVDSALVQACSAPAGTAARSDDCDDGDAAQNPGAVEVCNGEDDDCSAVSDDGGVCPCDVEHPSGDTLHPYLFCQSATDWATASLACQAVGYHLVTLSSSDENTWVDDTADTYSTEKWWTGMNDLTTEGSWGWADGSAVPYTNWSSGEPNDAGGDEDCGQLNRFHPIPTWNDEPCSSPFRYICEYE